MGETICCCDKADMFVCDRCIKNKMLNPKHIINIKQWKRNVTDIPKQIKEKR